MNKRIFSLVCITLYALLDVSIHCSEEKHDRSKEYGLRNRIIRVIKKIKRSNKKNDIESKRELQLSNNNNFDIKDGEEDIDDKDYEDETYDREYVNEDDIYNREYVNNDDVDDDEDDKGFNFLNTVQKDKKNKIKKTISYSKEPLTHLYNQIIEGSSNNNDSLSKVALQIVNALDDYIAKNPDVLRLLILFRHKSKIQFPNDKEYPPNAIFSVRNILHGLHIKDQKYLILLLLIIMDLDDCPQNSEANE
ncbi:Plasmodium yoelii subtelomeric region (PYST-C1), putative [Plasmodium chabaudi adami]|uniref:Plasmodium yoelii subtelomeric region (PYST-C1), putative n=1 Tax=Plasmodium chabaudi adami TaxID=5826 RepID=A0A1D3L7K2_PLACE|nr:Plasmodium yoelii subtelomeric region (PYST-C1), putative [Plasmodium chabaudi adami]